MKHAVLWAVLGAVFGTGLDAIHALTGVLSYPHPDLGVQPWWVPPEFALAGLAMGYGHRLVAMRVPVRVVPVAPSRMELASGIGAFVLAYGGSGFLKSVPVVATVLFVALFAVGAWMTPASNRMPLLMHAAGAGLTGPLVEAAISGAGLFSYASPDFMGVPMWLPGIYLNAAWATAVIDRALTAPRVTGATSST